MAQRRNLSEPLRAAFMAEVAARFPEGRSPSGHRFDDDRWFAGSKPELRDPSIVFEEDNIQVWFGCGGSHSHFFPERDDPASVRAAAQAALDCLPGVSSGEAAAPVPLLERRATGAKLGAFFGAAVWGWMMISETGRAFLAGSHVFAAVLLIGGGALAGTFLLVPPE